MYSRRPTSMPTTVSAGRVVQRGCEPRAINPLQGEKRERGRFLAPAILAQNEIFSITRRWPSYPDAKPLSPAKLFVAQVGCSLGAERSPGAGKAEGQSQQGRNPSRPQQRRRQEDPFDLDQPGDQKIGGKGAERARDECRQHAEQAVVDQGG